MIDWTSFDTKSASAWARLGEQLIATAQVAVTARDEVAMQAAMDDILAYVAKPSLAKPASCVVALRRVQTQLAQARQALAIGALADGSDKLDLIVTRMSSAANELKAERGMLQLAPVREALADAGDVVAQVKAVQAQLKSLPKEGIAEWLGAILAIAEGVFAKLRAVEGP